MIREELRKEGLFITEDNDEFFEKYIKSDDSGESENYIQRMTDKVLELQKEKKGNLWHCIFGVVMEPMKQSKTVDSDKADDEYSDLAEILQDLYRDPFFMALDVAQSIIYNLYRLGDRNEYYMKKEEDRKLWEKRGLDQLIDMGNRKYGETRILDLYFAEDCMRVKKKYDTSPLQEKQIVYLPRIVQRGKITLESNFMELNIAYVANNKFQDYLYNYKYDSDCYETLMGLIRLLNDKVSIPIQYIWEKMTNFNVINIETKFLTDIMRKKQMKEKDVKPYMEYIVKQHRPLFKIINSMTNVLTRLLILKAAFRYMTLNYSGIEDDLDGWLYKLADELYKLNESYSKKQRAILETAVSVRWYLDKKIDIGKWIKELEKEYPIKIFESLYLSMGINDNLAKLKDDQPIGDEDIGALQQEKNRFLFLAFKRYEDYVRSMQQLRLLNILEKGKYTDTCKKLANILRQKGWISVAAMEEAINKSEDIHFRPRIGGSVCTNIYEERSDLKKDDFEKLVNRKIILRRGEEIVGEYNIENTCKTYADTYEEKEENIKQVIRPWLLSRYNKVVFENDVSADAYGRYEKVFNALLYRIYQE